MKKHVLDIYPEYFAPVAKRLKNFEIRRNEGFEVGDYLLLNEFDPITQTYTNRRVMRKITYITDYAQQPPYVVLGIR